MPPSVSMLRSRIGDVAPRLRDSLPWSPFDFIRGLSTAGDRDLLMASLLRDLEASDDLRLVYPLPSGTDVVVCAERLPWDSRFFGFEVARLNGVFPAGPGGYSPGEDYGPALAALVHEARARGIRYLFSVTDSRDLPTIRALTALGFALIETRLCWHRSLRHYHHRRRFRCRLATDRDVDHLVRLAQSVDNPYDRFNADPYIPKEQAARLMVAWLRASVLHGFADATFIPDTPNPRAVCTLKYHDDRTRAWGTSVAQLVLAMASPEPGNGLVGTISEINYHLKDRGTEHVFFTTQASNRSAIRVGEHLGFRYAKAEHVFRLILD